MRPRPPAIPPPRLLRRHPLWLARPFAVGTALLSASCTLALAVPGLLDNSLFRLAFAAVELLVFWRYYLLPFIAWRAFRLLLGSDRIEVEELEHLAPARRQYSLFAATISITQRIWQIPLNIGTITVQTGAGTVRYTLLTPVRL